MLSDSAKGKRLEISVGNVLQISIQNHDTVMPQLRATIQLPAKFKAGRADSHSLLGVMNLTSYTGELS